MATEPISVIAWVRYPKISTHVDGHALAWTRRAVYIEWQSRGSASHLGLGIRSRPVIALTHTGRGRGPAPNGAAPSSLCESTCWHSLRVRLSVISAELISDFAPVHGDRQRL